MSQTPITHSFTTGGAEITLETGKLAKQADGSVVLRSGGTMLLATVVSSRDISDGIDFLPLTVDYREKFAAAGRFPGGFLKREARPSDNEILVSRLVDRAIRPMFPKDYHAETQLLISLISSDNETMPDSLACLAASAAILISDIPFDEPISEVRVSRINGEYVVNPALSDLDMSDIDMIIAGTESSILMVEGEMNLISEAEMLEAIQYAHEAIKAQCNALKEFVDKSGNKEAREYAKKEENESLMQVIQEFAYNKCYEIAEKGTGKNERSELFAQVLIDYKDQQTEEFLEENGHLIGEYFSKVKKAAVRNLILEKGIRLDGRKTDEIRPIWCEVDYLPSTHGSSIFTRGETQSLTTVTLGTKLDEQTIDGAFISGTEKFILHYNFPPFSTGEAKPIRGVSRREVGHGNLALRALKAVVPVEDNPYTVRVVSDILESNGSSSMATVCAGSLALMDAGVQTKGAVSGIAMGLIKGEGDSYAVLSDILGDEDFLGDMDFKVAGTKEGISACQMDIKIQGISFEIMEKALAQANAGRLHILDAMNGTIEEARHDYKPHAPRIEQLIIDKEMIGAVIGPGGKIIQDIQAKSGATITIEEVDGKGIVDISATDKDSIDMALARVKGIVAVPEVGEIYDGTVKAIANYGAFVEILPGKDGLLHISEIDWKRTENVSDVFKEGDKVEVKLVGIDPKTGKIKLSRKILLPRPEKKETSSKEEA